MKNQKIILIIILLFNGNFCFFLLDYFKLDHVEQVDIESKNVKVSDSINSTCPYEFFFNKSWGGTYNDSPLSIDSDSSGNIYIAGRYDHNSGVAVYSFLSKLNKKGDFLWNKTFSGSDLRIAQIQVKGDKIYAIGNYGYVYDKLVLHIYDLSGALLFNKTFNLAEPVSIYALTVDSLNNIYVVGSWHWSYYPDGFICKISSTYSIEWYRSWWRSPNPQLKGCFLAVALDNNEDIIVTGYTLTLDPRYKDILLVKYYKNGTCAWDKWWGSSRDEWGRQVLVDSNDNIYHLSTENVKNVTKFTHDGTIIWTKTLHNPNIQVLKFIDMVLDSSEDLIVFGKIWLSGGEKLILLKYNKNGSLEWNFTRDVSLGIYFSSDGALTLDKYENICFTSNYYSPNNYREILLNKIIINHEPSITRNSNNFTAGYGTSGHILSWHAIDFDGNYDTYWIERNEEKISEGIWTYDMDIEFAEMNDSLPLGVYNYICFVKDLYGCINQSSIYMTIAHIPYYSNIKIPNNNIYSPNAEYTFNCSWFDEDGAIQEVKFEFNSQNFTVKSNYSGEFSYTLRDLSANESGYNFRWHAMDNDGNWQTTDIIKFVLHKQNSELKLLFNNTSGDHTALMDGELNITVYNIDLLQGFFQLYVNQELFQEITGISLSNISQFSTGIYNVTAVFYNTNYTGKATNWLNIINYPYFVNQISNFDIFEGDIYKTITWTPIDDLGSCDSFWIQKDGINIINGTWDGSEIVFLDLFNLQAGVYNFTCFVNNTFGLQNSSTIIITVLPNNNPFIDRITSDFTVNVGTIGYSLSWYVVDIDSNNFTYWIERNGVRIDSGFWDNDTNIIYIELDVLDTEIYNYTCFINDTSGAMDYSSIFVTIINHEPQIVNNINDFTVNFGTVGYSLSWYVIDIDGNNLSYWIERNGVRIDSGFWDNDTNIIYIEFNVLDVEIYNYTCFINDSLGFISQSSIFIKINSFPQYSGIIIPSIDTYTPNLDYIFNCSWFDIDGIINEVKIEFKYQNYTVLNNFYGEYTYIFKDLAANEIGYKFRWHAKDSDGAWNSTEWQTYILSKQVLELLILFNGTQENLIDSYNPIVNITIFNLNSSPGILKLFVDSLLVKQIESYSLTSISQYLNGVYNITTILIDQNYTGYAMQWLNVQEISPPVIIFDFSGDYLNSTIPEYYHCRIRINCSVFDSSPLYWVYLCENSSGIFLNRSMIDLGNGDWVYEIDISHLNWNDVFIFYFIANDTWGNIGINDNFTSLYRVNVFDFQNPISTISYAPYDYLNIINVSTSFKIIADDIGSGISLVRYKINDSEWIEYTQSFNLSSYGPGTYNISYYSIDNAGNIEEIKSITVVLIKTEESITQGAIPSFNLGILISIISITSVIILFKEKSKKS